MVRVIMSATLIVLLAVLVAFNLRYTTSISVYGAEFTGVPVMVVALLSFALGVVYSVVLYVGRYLGRARRKGIEERHQQVTKREQEVAARESALSREGPPADVPSANPGLDSAVAPPPGEPRAAAPGTPVGGKLRRLFRAERSLGGRDLPSR